MGKLWRDIDRLLRGELTRTEHLSLGRFDVPVERLALGAVLLGGVYGATMGLFAYLRSTNSTFEQFLAGAVKVPLLFLLTLLVTFPSLYVFSALARSPLRVETTLKLLLAAIAVTLALLASFAPVLVFFTLSTKSYPFTVLLNVLFFAGSGWIGLAFLRSALRRLFPPVASARAAEAPHAATSDTPQLQQQVFTVWMLVYGLVGAQMGWILRPFIGDPELPFAWFRPREESFFEAVATAFRLWLG